MFKLPEISAAFVAAVLIVFAIVLGLFNLSPGNIFVVGLALLLGAVIGVGLGRNSKTANATYDRLLAETEHLRAVARGAAARAKLDEVEARLRGND